jgi:hypothetical protein
MMLFLRLFGKVDVSSGVDNGGTDFFPRALQPELPKEVQLFWRRICILLDFRRFTC